MGKVSILFQRSIFPGARREKYGHTGAALQLVSEGHHSCNELPPFFELIPKHLISRDETAGDPDAGLRSLLICTLCHHGTPYRPSHGLNDKHWQPQFGLDPATEVRRLVEQARTWFPKVDSEHARLPYEAPRPEHERPGPLHAPFLHGWNAILTLADWIGSSEQFFPYREPGDPADRLVLAKDRALQAIRHIGLDVIETRASLQAPLSFESIFPFPPRPAQARLGALTPAEQGSTAVLEAGTGSGKTEAALWYFAQLFRAGAVDGFYFALPTRSAATQIQRRMETGIREGVFKHLSSEQRPAVIQAVPGYLRADGEDGTLVSRFEVEWSDAHDQGRSATALRAWAAERGKRYTAGGLVIGTVDQVLLSALQVRHAHLRLAGLMRHLLIVDEVHASDSYMGKILEAVILRHRHAGGHVLLMSATLGSSARQRFLHPARRPTKTQIPFEQAVGTPYPAIHLQQGDLEAPAEEPIALPVDSERPKNVIVSRDGFGRMDDPGTIARLALDAALDGARVLVIRNTVKGCLAVQDAVEALAHDAGRHDLLFGLDVPAPHHSRYDRAAREALDRAIESAFSPTCLLEPGCVAVTTQTVEQSLDIDADLLITDLCPMDVLLQRIGRLHRHEIARPRGYDTAQIVVLTPDVALADLIKESGETFGPHGLGGLIYHDLRILEATRQELEARAASSSALELPAHCRRLVESATHPEILKAVGQKHRELADHWKNHGYKVTGQMLREKQLAQNALFPWHEAFGDFAFGDNLDQAIQTRLGTRDILVQLPGEPAGPFGHPVRELAIRPYELPEDALGGEPVAEDVTASDRAVTFGFAGVRFRYDRLGLRVE